MIALFPLFNKNQESQREKELSAQVDQLEFELAKAKRESEAARIRQEETQRQFEEHKLRDYPAAGSWVGQLTTSDLFDSRFQNPVEYVLSDVEALGYDVSAAWMVHRAVLDLAKQHEQGVAKIQSMVNQLAGSKAELI